MKDKYTLGYFRSLTEYMVAVGHKVVRIQEELVKTVLCQREEEGDQNEAAEVVLEAAEDNVEQEDRPALVAAGFPRTSFIDPVTPSRARQIGVTARVQVRREGEEQCMRRRKCVRCQKKFVDGKKRKSTVVKCTSCSELTHLRCAKNAATPFYCCKCPNPGGPVDVEEVQVFLQSALEDRLLDAQEPDLEEHAQLSLQPVPVPLEVLAEAEPVPLFTSTQVIDQLVVLSDVLRPAEAEEAPVVAEPVLPSTSAQVFDQNRSKSSTSSLFSASSLSP